MLYPAELKIKKCPFGCDADLELQKESIVFKTKGSDIVGDRWVYKCPICSNGFTTTESDTISMENLKFEEYMIDARQQLNCNAELSYKQKHITYGYTNEQVDENLEYFERCMNFGLSPYKALLFFGEYLKGDYEI